MNICRQEKEEDVEKLQKRKEVRREHCTQRETKKMMMSVVKGGDAEICSHE